MTMSSLFSQTQLRIGNRTVHVAFTSVEAGNLGLHVGDDFCGVLNNRQNLEAEVGLPAGSFAYLNQVHGVEVAEPTLDGIHVPEVSTESGKAELASAPVADAAVSTDGRPLAIMVADCIPLVLVGENSQGPVLAVAHAGRRGLLDGVIQEAVSRMRAKGAQEIRIWLGPSICGHCYEVPQSMQEESEAIAPGISSTSSWGTPALDLPARAETIARGLPGVVSVDRSLAVCTLENKEVFSHRRGDAGRIAGLVWIEDYEGELEK